MFGKKNDATFLKRRVCIQLLLDANINSVTLSLTNWQLQGISDANADFAELLIVLLKTELSRLC